MAEVEFYNGNEILGYDDRPFKFVIGNRSTGKSFFWKCYCIKRFLTHGEKFIYIRRYYTDIEDVAPTFFEDVSFKFPGVEFEEKDCDFYINGEYAGTSESVSRFKKLKSKAQPDIMNLFFDEFLDEDGRYIKGEVGKIQSIYQSVARGNGDVIRDDVKFIFVANHVSFYNPYFKALKIRLTPESKYIKAPSSIVEVFQNEGVSEAIKQSNAGGFLSLGEYGRSLVEGNFILDSNTFIRPLAKNSSYMLTIKYDGESYGVYRGQDGDYYISSKVNKEFRKKFVFSNSDHEIDWIFVENWRKVGIFPELKRYYDNGRLWFTNHGAKRMFLDVMQYTT